MSRKMGDDINLVRRENSLYFKEISLKAEVSEKDSCEGYLIDSTEKEIRRTIEALKKSSKKIAILAKDELSNRRFLETLNFDYLVSPEINKEKDSLKQRSSGLNHILAKTAKEKGVCILISLSKLESLDQNSKTKSISRIIQNIKVARKTGCQIKMASLSKNQFYTKKERERIGTSWGMSSQQSSRCCSF